MSTTTSVELHTIIFKIEGDRKIASTIPTEGSDAPNDFLSLSLSVAHNRALNCRVWEIGVVIKRGVHARCLCSFAIRNHVFDRLGVVSINRVTTFDDDKANTCRIHLAEINRSVSWVLIITDVHAMNSRAGTECINLSWRCCGRSKISNQG